MEKPLLGILLFVIVMGLTWLIYLSRQRFRKFREGVKAFKTGDNAEALKIFSELSLKYKEYDIIYNRGIANLKLENYSQAESDFLEAIEIEPNRDHGHTGLLALFFATEEWDKLYLVSKRLLNYDNHKGIALNAKGSAEIELGEYEAANESFNEALKVTSFPSIIYNNLSYLKLQTGDFEGAVADGNKSIELSSEDPFPYNNRGFAFANLKEYDKAFEDYERSYQLDPNNAHLFLHRGITHFFVNNYDAALEDLQKSIKMKPSLKQKAVPYIAKILESK